MSNIKVSIIIPVYNVEQYIKQCLDSVINQTLKDIEIICIDDKSTDNSLQILKEYKQKDSRIVLIEHNNNLGVSASRNDAINIAKGEYIIFLDSDDFLELNYCEILFNIAKQNNLKLVYNTNVKYYISENKIKKRSHANLPNNKLLYIDSKNINKLYWSACQIMVKRDILKSEHITFPLIQIAEDLYFNKILYSYIYTNNEPLATTNKTTYYYRKQSNSTLTSKISTTTDEIKSINLIYENYKSRNLLDKLPIPLPDQNMLQSSSIKSIFYKELRQLFLKIKQDNLVNYSLYQKHQLIFMNSCLASSNYSEYQIQLVIDNIIPKKEIIKIFNIPVLRITNKNYKRVYYLFNFLPILTRKRK